jgi:molybdopterin-guanine dinucleotide biosynthesis protein B
MRIIGLAGWSGSGKTTLIKKLIPSLIARGSSVSTLKHAHHGFDLDQPGKDSFFHRTAGATEVIISSARRWAILHELREEPEWDLPALVAKMSPVDLVLVEGFKRDAFPKLEIHRAANGKPLIHPDDPHIVAIAADIALPQAKIPVIDLNNVEAIADLLLKYAAPVAASTPPQGVYGAAHRRLLRFPARCCGSTIWSGSLASGSHRLQKSNACRCMARAVAS